MFTGIVSNTVEIKSHTAKNRALFLTIAKPPKWKLRKGDSIAVDGVCLTIKKIVSKGYEVELMTETLKKTTFGKRIPKKINLEQPLKFGGTISGHFVSGHIDAVGKIEKITKEGTSKQFFISYPKQFRHFLAKKGSITVDGISLTIVAVTLKYFSVAILPYTLQHTTISTKNVGGWVNLEFDILAKYAIKNLKTKI